MAARRVTDSQVSLHHLMRPEHTNYYGTVHGGVIMKMVDETAGLCALRHCRRRVATVAIDSMAFYSPIEIGNLVTFEARLNWVGRTSMEVEVKVTAENPLTGQRTHTNTAYLVFVALDDEGQAIEVPALSLETEPQRQRWAEAEQRRRRRLEQRES